MTANTAQTPAEQAPARIGSELPLPVPTVRPDTREFWEATADGRLLLTKCLKCAQPAWYPRGFCPHCGNREVEWVEASGRGEVYSYTVVRRGGLGEYRDASPYILAYVELDEGVRMMTNIVDVDEDALRIGLPVQVAFQPTGEGPALPRFTPAD